MAHAQPVQTDRRELAAKAYAAEHKRTLLRDWRHKQGTWGPFQAKQFIEAADAVGATAYVVGAHTSKSQEVPVVLFVFGGGTAYVVYRENHFDGVATVLVNDDLDLNAVSFHQWTFDHIRQGDEFWKAYAEGFPEPLICGTYAQNQRAFTSYISRADLGTLLGAVARTAGSGIRRTG